MSVNLLCRDFRSCDSFLRVEVERTALHRERHDPAIQRTPIPSSTDKLSGSEDEVPNGLGRRLRTIACPVLELQIVRLSLTVAALVEVRREDAAPEVLL